MRPTLAALALLAALFTARPSTAAEVVIVVHPETEVDSVSRGELSKIFLKRLRTWASGESVQPVDQPADSAVRQAFSRRVHERSVITIEVYWKRMVFSGRTLPPKILASDAEILDFVRDTPGAVGYVAADADTRGVKTLAVVE